MAVLRLGIHTSTSAGLAKAAEKAAELGANTFQIFSASPRMWRASMPSAESVEAIRAVRRRRKLAPLLIHANYLINLASGDSVIRERSVVAFRGELERALAIGAEYLVVHPGSTLGGPLLEGVAAVAVALEEASRGLASEAVTVLLENTVGAGSTLGGRLEDLRRIRDLAGRLTGLKVGYCLDTCHLLASGYDVATAEGLKKTAQEIEGTLGLENVHAFHANDSKGRLGSRVDRHENIGEGQIGTEGFRRILRHHKLRSKPFILETPVEQPGDDRRNLETLKALARR
jgi:deoxyribonuclease-4